MMDDIEDRTETTYWELPTEDLSSAALHWRMAQCARVRDSWSDMAENLEAALMRAESATKKLATLYRTASSMIGYLAFVEKFEREKAITQEGKVT